MIVITPSKKPPLKVWNQLYKGAQQGSEIAIARLFELTEPRIRSMANYAGRTATAKEDLYAVGCEGFMSAINNKKPVKKAENYIIKYIRLEMQKARQNAAIYAKRFLSVDADSIGSKLNEQRVFTRTSDRHISKNPEAMTFVNEIFEYIKALPQKKSEIVLSKIVYGEESKAIGERLNMTSNNVDKIFERSRKEIRQWAEKIGKAGIRTREADYST